MRLSEAARAVGGRLVGPDVVFDGASIDSRAIDAGQLFVPVLAARDGHDFVPDALAAEAAGYLTSREPQGGSAVVVEDTVEALQAVGSLARDRLIGPVVAITGSVGKTSVKDLAAATLSAGLRTHASRRSFNNELGVPITLLGAPDDTEVTVVEMGARGPGHIRSLCAVARPTVGVVTMVAAAHTSEFASLEEIGEAKQELVEALPPGGTAVLFADDRRVAAMATATDARVVTFGLDESADVRATGIELDEMLRPSFRLDTPEGSVRVRLGVAGVHNVVNALAAAAVARVAGLDLAEIALGLGRAELSPWRMALQRTAAGGVVINDAYNANPTSMEAALRSLAALDAQRRVAIVGLMAELGAGHAQAHEAMARLAAELGIEVIAVAEPAYGVNLVPDIDAAAAAVGVIGPDVAVLVKGSRVAGLELLAQRLVA